MLNTIEQTGLQTLVTYSDKKGTRNITIEGAVFKGGAAMAALKDIALDSALARAVNGKYRSASDILGVAFPRTAKAVETLFCEPTWASKRTFAALVAGCVVAKAGKNGWTKKQDAARMLVHALVNTMELEPKNEGEIIEV